MFIVLMLMVWFCRLHALACSSHNHSAKPRTKNYTFCELLHITFVVCVCVDGMFFFRVLCSSIEWNKSTGWTEWVSKQCGKMCVIVTHKYHVTHLSLLLVLVLLLADWRSWSCSFFLFFEVHTFYISVIHISESTQLSPSSFTLILRVVDGMRWTEMD